MRFPWSVAAVLSVTTFIHYLDRNNLAIVLPEIARSFGWSDQEVGEYGEWILGAFYASFGLVQIFLSPYAERWGLRRSLLSSVVGFSVVTLLFYPLGRSVEAIISTFALYFQFLSTQLLQARNHRRPQRIHIPIITTRHQTPFTRPHTVSIKFK